MPAFSFAQKLDTFLDRIYGFDGVLESPRGVNGQVWAMPQRTLSLSWTSVSPESPDGSIQPGEAYFLHYFQSQGCGPTTNECVTTSVLMCMNILTEWVSASVGQPIESNKRIEDYASELDEMGLRGWRYRFPTKSLLPGMMHPRQAVFALKDHAVELQKDFKKSYKVKLSSRHTVDDLVQYIWGGNLLLVHGAWQVNLGSEKYHLAYMGGMPHTMVLVGYDRDLGKWILLNPGNPMSAKEDKSLTPKLYKMSTEQFLNFWGRRFLFYPPRFSITRITLDA